MPTTNPNGPDLTTTVPHAPDPEPEKPKRPTPPAKVEPVAKPKTAKAK